MDRLTVQRVLAIGTRLAAILGRPHAATALIYLQDNPGASANKLARGIGASEAAVGVNMAQHLEAYGLAHIGQAPAQIPGRTAMVIELTLRGEKLARLLREAADIVPDDNPESKTDRALGAMRRLADHAKKHKKE